MIAGIGFQVLKKVCTPLPHLFPCLPLMRSRPPNGHQQGFVTFFSLLPTIHCTNTRRSNPAATCHDEIDTYPFLDEINASSLITVFLSIHPPIDHLARSSRWCLGNELKQVFVHRDFHIDIGVTWVFRCTAVLVCFSAICGHWIGPSISLSISLSPILLL